MGFSAVGRAELRLRSAQPLESKEQKSISLEKHAEATYAGWRDQKASGSGGRDSDYL